MDPNFVPCTFLRPSFVFLLTEERGQEDGKKKLQEREHKKEEQGKTSLTKIMACHILLCVLQSNQMIYHVWKKIREAILTLPVMTQQERQDGFLFLYKGIRIGEVGQENPPAFLLPFFFLEKKEIRKRQGKHKRGIPEQNNMDSDRVTGEMGITGSNRSIFCLLHLRLLYYSFCLYSSNTGSLYYANIQYTQLLYWAILGVHTYYPVSLILGYSNSPVLR